MRFVDATVFLYAYLRPKKAIPNEIAEIKKAARTILRRINTSDRHFDRFDDIKRVCE